jgi:hypothetical protein
MDTLQRFPRAWCDTCGKVRPVTLNVMPANDKNPYAAADIVCDECRSIIATQGRELQMNVGRGLNSCAYMTAFILGSIGAARGVPNWVCGGP